MEAATPLPFSKVRALGDEVLIESLRVADPCAVRLVREREEAGEAPDRIVRDAIEIGVRVLDREQTGADVELLRKELERTSADVGQALSANADKVGEQLATKVAELFGPDTGVVTKILARHFSDDSSGAVQHRVKAAMEEVMARQRDELRRQFTAADGSNPLALFQKATVDSIEAAAGRQHAHLREMGEKLTTMTVEIERLRAEKEKLSEVAAEAEKGTAKGRTYEEAVAEALDVLAAARGDDCEAVGDVRGEGGRKGDVLVGIEGSSGPARGRIVFEAKNSKLSRQAALAELDGALQARGAEYAVLVVPSEDKLPARTHALREFNGDKLFVVFDPDEASTLALEVAYGLARARVLMARGGDDGVDAAQVRAEVERAQGAMDEVRRIKSQLTNARTGIDNAQQIVEAMATAVRGHLAQIDALLDAAEPAGDA
jgi:hypothetical protein